MKKIISLAALSLVSVMASQAVMAHSSDYVLDSAGKHPTASDGDCVTFGGAVNGADCHSHDEPVVEAPVAEVAPVIEPVAITQSFTLAGDTSFDTNSAELNSNGKASLDAFVNTLAGTEGLEVDSIFVVGHADSRGSDAYNQTLSEKRADAVSAYLASAGIDSSVLSASGAGESKPVASNDTASGRAQNRRVELEVLGITTK